MPVDGRGYHRDGPVTYARRDTYRPRGTATELLARRDPEILLAGPAGTGKSRAALQKLHLVALLTPGVRLLIVRQTAESLGSTALVTYREHVAKTALEVGDVAFYGGSAEEAAHYRYRNGSSITLMGMNKPGKVMSSEYDMIYVQEAVELTETGWEALTTRLRNNVLSFQQLLADTNPSHPTHWLYQRCLQGRCVLLESRHEDNPVYFHPDGAMTKLGEAYLGTLDRLTGVRLQRLRHGKWVAAEGLIYERWSTRLHLVRKHVPADWPRLWVVDFGYVNPMVVQMWAVDPDGRLYLYREYYQTGVLVEDMARTILADLTYQAGPRKGEWRVPRPDAVICDHDAEDRATLERHLGITTTAAKKSVSDGIQATQARMKPADDGRARIQLHPEARVSEDRSLRDAGRPTSSVEEITSYVWDTSPDLPRDRPLKVDDHGMDCMRYVVAHLDLVPELNVRWM